MRFFRRIILSLSSSVLLMTCRASGPSAQVSDFEIADGASADNTYVERPDGDAASRGPYDALDNPASERRYVMHRPKEPTAWFTRRLLMTSPQPSAKRINECRERVEAVIKDAPNLRALNEASLSLQATILNSPNLYHWCFYQIMADLDIRLENEAPLMSDKAEIFLTRMRALWVMAKALDQTLPDKGYMGYLRTRYTDINQNVFGRTLEIMDLETVRQSEVSAQKAAAAFDE